MDEDGNAESPSLFLRARSLPEIARVNPARPRGGKERRENNGDGEYLSFPVITCGEDGDDDRPLLLRSPGFLDIY